MRAFRMTSLEARVGRSLTSGWTRGGEAAGFGGRAARTRIAARLERVPRDIIWEGCVRRNEKDPASERRVSVYVGGCRKSCLALRELEPAAGAALAVFFAL